MRLLAHLPARLLRPDEREAVLGDLAEAGVTGLKATFEIAGLVARRQAALWKSWRPWLALFVAIPAGWLLGWYLGRAVLGEQRGLDLWIVMNRRDLDPAVLAEYGLSVRHAVIALAQGVVLLTGTGWASGLALGWLAGRAALMHAVLFTVLVAFCPLPGVLRNDEFGTFTALALLVMLPAGLGISLGRKASA